jgi:hypothetical protein
VKEYKVQKEISKELSIPLLSLIGKSLTEEYSNQGKSKGSIIFEFNDGYERFKETTIEKFIEECKIKKDTTIDFSCYDKDKHFSINIEYDTPFSALRKINPPNARFYVWSNTNDQIWSEGIVNKFSKLINEFEISQINEKPMQLKIDEKPIPSKINQKPNHSFSFIKSHLSQIIIGIATSIVGSIIVLWYFTPSVSP